MISHKKAQKAQENNECRRILFVTLVPFCG
jgi:hypothetical protein